MTASSHEKERSFGLSVGAVSALFMGVSLWRGHEAVACLWAALAIGLLGAVVTQPSLLRWPSALWWRLANGLGWVNARILLSAVFFGIMTPVGVVLRLTGWDPLRRRRASATTGWTSYPERMRDVKHYEHLY